MKKRYMTRSAVFILVENKAGQYLFQKRQNTGYLDGAWDAAASGHVEEGETAKEAALRELKEEIGLEVKKDAMKFVGVCHRFDESVVYYDFYFHVIVSDALVSQIKICESHKISQIDWLSPKQIQGKVIDYVGKMIENYQAGIHYEEWGW